MKTKTYLMIGGGLLALLVLNQLTKTAKNNSSIVDNIGESIGGAVVGSASDLVFGTAAGVVGALSPYNDQNIFYRGVNKLGGAITQDKSFNLGGWIYDKTH